MCFKMAELCEICLKLIKRWKDTNGNVRYEGVILCNNCQDKVEEISNKCQGEKSFEVIIKELKRKKKK